MNTSSAILKQVDANMSNSVDKLVRLLSFPSVSSQPEGKEGILACAEWLRLELAQLGFDAKIAATDGHPFVIGTTKSSETHSRILFYGHYDVQPAEPLDEWKSQPFQAEIRGEDGLERIYARGASDSKSQFWAIIEALRAWKDIIGSIPADVTIMLEGEEETGSQSLAGFIRENKDLLACDVVFNSDSDMWSPGKPAITTRMKGLIHEKVTIIGPNGDLHSGHFGNVAVNPIRILTNILNAIHSDTGRVEIENFYDGVDDVTPLLRDKWDNLNVEEALCGVSVVGGPEEDGLGIIERMWGRPGIDFNGIWGGNTGPSERSVLPACASARLTFRLVDKQQPEKVRRLFRSFVEARLPAGCQVEFEGDGGSAAATVNEASPYILATARALEAEWGQQPLIKGTGGTVPVVGLLTEELGVDCVTVGFILNDDAIHAPNERYDVERLRKSTRSWVRILSEVWGAKDD